jgi:DHA1 family multidrug resistance protein-like MFS transporter
MRKIATPHKHRHGKVLSWMVLLSGFSIGLTLPIFPNFVKSILNTDSSVSFFYSAMAMLMFCGALLSTFIFKRIERSIILRASLLILSASFLFLVFTTRLTELSILTSIQVWLTLYLTMCLSLFVRDFAKNKDLGEEEGVFYKYHNLGYLFGPLIGGFLASYISYELVFILTALCFIIGFIYFYHLHIIRKHPAILSSKSTHKYSIFENIKRFAAEKDRIKAYIITAALMSWIGFKRLYIPLYVVFSGFIESMTGLILALGIIPLIFLEVKVGKYADKKGIRKPISFGFLIIAFTLFIIFASPNHFINFILIILANIGTAFIEPLQEYYLFKHMPEKEENSLYGIYMTADPLAFFLTPLIGAVTLLFLPFNYIFLVFGILLFGAGAFSWLTLQEEPDRPTA